MRTRSSETKNHMCIRLSFNIQLTMMTAVQAYLWVCDLHYRAEKLLVELINVQFTLMSKTLSTDASNNLKTETGTGNMLSYAHYGQRPSLHVESNTYGPILTRGPSRRGGKQFKRPTSQPGGPVHGVPVMFL